METAIILIIGLMALALIIKRISRTATIGDCGGGFSGGCHCIDNSCSTGKKCDEIDITSKHRMDV